MKKIFFAIIVALMATSVAAQEIPEHISYTQIYDFLDELAADGIIELNSTVKPYPRTKIAAMLATAFAQKQALSRRQQADLTFFMQEYMLESDRLPETFFELYESRKLKASLAPPAVYYRDIRFFAPA